ncbi:MAG: hydroxymethylglutaryl-CoA reductase, degradative [Thermoplasmatota archaeon]
MGSDLKGLYKDSIEERRRRIIEEAGLTPEDLDGIGYSDPAMSVLDGMIENVIGTFQLPIGIATNFRINGVDRLIPMAIEEPSVVAAASKAAKIARKRGGFRTESTGQIMIGQIQVVDIPDVNTAEMSVEEAKEELLGIANDADPLLVKFGGGARDLEIRRLSPPTGEMMVIHLLVDCLDAMGANAVNTMAERIAPRVEDITGGSVLLRILTNLAVKRLASAEAVFDRDELGGPEVVDAIIKTWEMAAVDPYRASTHNKGVMNGVSAVVRATGNDTRAVEAGAHSYAAFNGRYEPLTKYRKDGEGNLVGNITLPAAVGLVGGATKVHPAARSAVKILGITKASELGEILAAVGLAQNLGALRALATEGIQRGHMKLHARNLALQAGAENDEVPAVIGELVKSGQVTASNARDILDRIRGSDI